MLVCGYRVRSIWYKYKMMKIELIVVEKWVAWENVLDLRSRAGSALDDKY